MKQVNERTRALPTCGRKRVGIVEEPGNRINARRLDGRPRLLAVPNDEDRVAHLSSTSLWEDRVNFTSDNLRFAELGLAHADFFQSGSDSAYFGANQWVL